MHDVGGRAREHGVVRFRETESRQRRIAAKDVETPFDRGGVHLPIGDEIPHTVGRLCIRVRPHEQAHVTVALCQQTGGDLVPEHSGAARDEIVFHGHRRTRGKTSPSRAAAVTGRNLA